MSERQKELHALRQKLVLLAHRIDSEVPNHGYDSALALASEAGGVEQAIALIDERLRVLQAGNGKRVYDVRKEKLTVKRKTEPKP